MIIKTENLSYIYNQGNPFEIKALDNINLEFEEGILSDLLGIQVPENQPLFSILTD